MSLAIRNPVFGVSDQVRHNRAVKPQKMGRDLILLTKEIEGLFYRCGENKCADQLRGYCAADLCLCFCICKKQVFS